MRTRIISGLTAGVLFLVVMYFFQTPVLNVGLTLISALGIYEILSATKFKKNKLLSFVCILMATVIPSISYISKLGPNINSWVVVGVAFLLFGIIVFSLMLKLHSQSGIELAYMAILMTIIFPLSISTIILLRDLPIGHNVFYLFLVFFGAWISDTGAYFSGYFFGKHKLAPVISPKKTVEGAVGGVITLVIFYVVYAFIYGKFCVNDGSISYITLIILAVIASLLSILGDLTFSVIKRTCDIKDFGKIMPGHGGVLDRFDSLLFVAPAVYLFVQIFPIIK